MGVVWDSTQIDLTQSFDITLSVNQQPWGADGIALVLQNTGLADFGCGANGIGYGLSAPAAPGYTPISPSIAFEVDTWDNTGSGLADIPADHVGIHVNGDLTTAIGGPVDAISGGTDITDGFCHRLRVTWLPTTNTLRVYFDGVQRILINYDMINLVFGGNPLVWWGITGSSGGAGMTQIVCVGAEFANVGPDRSVCFGDTLNLLATGGTSFAWQPGPPLLSATNVPNPVFGPAAVGTYTVYSDVTNVAGCTDRDTTLLTVEAIPTANTGGPTTVCIGDSIQLGAAPNPAYSYQWAPALGLSSTTAAQPWAFPPSIGPYNYTLIVTDTAGMAACADTAAMVLTAVDTPAVTVSAVNDTVCQGVFSTLTAAAGNGSPPFTYLWNNGAVTLSQAVSPMVTTTYNVTVTDAAMCTTSGTVTVVVNDTPAVTISALPDTICAGATSTLSSSAVGVGPFTFLWSTGATTSSDVIAPLATVNPSVTITDPMGCQGIGTTQVVVNVLDSIAITIADTFVCQSGSIQILNTYATGGINTWSWQPPTGVSNPSNPNPLITPTASTTYYLSGTNSSTGCGYTDSIRINFFGLGPPVVDLGPDTSICAGDSLLLDAGNPGFTYAWASGATTQQVIATAAGVYSVRVFDTIGCGYFDQDTLILIVNVPPLPQIGPDTILCQGDSLQLNTGGAVGNCSWSTGSTASTLWITQAGTYWLTVSDSIGCRGSDTMALSLNPRPAVSIAGLLPQYCVLDSGSQLVGNPAGGNFSGAVSATGYFAPSVEGPGYHSAIYSFVDALGCTGADTLGTAVMPLPSPAVAGLDQQVASQAILQAIPPAIGTGQWTLGAFSGTCSATGDPNAVVVSDNAGIFPFVWTVANSPCPSNNDTVWITFEGIHIPTAFSPNGDGVNDSYVIRGLGGFPGTKLRIFNRWGNEVWASENYQNDWRGENALSQPLVEDTYYALIEYGGRAVTTYVVLKRD
jgi:gliding motility-associated-like protein